DTAVCADRRMLMNQRAEVAAHDDEVNSGVGPVPRPIVRERLPRRLIDCEGELLRLSRGESDGSEARKPERPRGADGQLGRARRAAPCEQQDQADQCTGALHRPNTKSNRARKRRFTTRSRTRSRRSKNGSCAFNETPGK